MVSHWGIFHIFIYLKNLRWILPNPASQPKAVNSLFETLFMPPTLKKWEHIGFGLSVSASVRVCVHLSVQKKNQARVLKFHIWIPRQK